MSLTAIDNTDYVNEVASLREHIRFGTRPDVEELLLLLQLLLDSATRASDAVADFQVQMDILNAFTGSDSAATIVAGIADADTAWQALFDTDGPLDAPAIEPDTVLDGLRS